MESSGSLLLNVGLIMVGTHPWLADLIAGQLAPGSTATRLSDTRVMELLVLALGAGYIITGALT